MIYWNKHFFFYFWRKFEIILEKKSIALSFPIMWIWSKQTQPLCFELFFRNPLLERKPSEDLSCLKKEGRALILFVILMCKQLAFVWGWISKTVWLLMEWKHFIAKTYQKMLEHCLQQGPKFFSPFY